MKKIIGVFNPFIVKQDFYLYEDGNKLDNVSYPIQGLTTKILEYAKENEVSEINLSGPNFYTKKFAKELQEKNITNYSNAFKISMI